MAERQPIEFYYDISCPFAYIASTKVESLAKRTRAEIIWRPVLLGAIYRATNAPQGAGGSASDLHNATKLKVTAAAFQRSLVRNEVTHNKPDQHPQKTTRALRLLYFVDKRSRPALTHALYRAYWVDNKPVGNVETLIDAVRQCRLSDEESIVKSIEDGSFEGPQQRRNLEEATDAAIKRGAFGVPSFWIPNEAWTDSEGFRHQGRLYWGQDRMHFVEAVLLALNEGRGSDSLARISTPLRSLMPRAQRNGIPDGDEVKLEFWYDFSSPWAFLGWTQLAALRRQYPQLQVDMKPFLLGILFREIGAPNLPMAAISDAKRKYSQWDHICWTRWWNSINVQEGRPDKDIDFYWADVFPIRTPSVLRAVLAEPQLDDALYRACWERNLNMSDDAVLEQVIAAAGFDNSYVMSKANSPEIKAELRARTKEAKDTGICGVPSYRVFRRRSGESAWKQHGDLVWGQDEIATVEDYICGWEGESAARVLAEPSSKL